MIRTFPISLKVLYMLNNYYNKKKSIISRKVKAISDAQLMNLRDRGDVVSPLHLIIR